MTPHRRIDIGGRGVGDTSPVFIVAELSANHGGSYDRALEILHAAKDARADAIKLQTYTADTLTIRSDRPDFQIGGGTAWDGRTLHDLYEEAHTPWDWQPKLKAAADELGLICFSTPFDATAVDFLEEMDVPAHKIASFEIVDLALIEKAAGTGKPIIISTGMATEEEVDEAVCTARATGNDDIVLLKCTSSYPAPPNEMHLRTIPYLRETFDAVPGLSDHTLGIAVPVAAVALGAKVVEKHLTLSRDEPTPDSSFSLEPKEFAEMVEAVRATEEALGDVRLAPTDREQPSLAFRRSLYVVRDVETGELYTEENVRSIRPGYGLAPRHLADVLGRRATRDLPAGTPLDWEFVD